MPKDLVTVSEAARRLGLSRSRVEAMVQAGQLPAQKVGSRWVLEPARIRAAEHLLYQAGGRPLGERSAWREIDELIGGRLQPANLDSFRRRVRPRAQHRDLYIHDGMLSEIAVHTAAIVSGRDAAIDFDAPVDEDGHIDVYVKAEAFDQFLILTRAREVDEGANAHLHVVESWPFEDGQHFVHPWIAWLDLEDRQDRAAEVVLDRLVGGRLRA